MKVILLKDVKNIGKKGDVVELKDAYARNVIIGKQQGVEATPQNLNNLKLKNANDEKVAKQQLDDATSFAKELENKTIKLSIKQGEGGKAFGSISTKEIAAAVKEQLGYEIDKKKIMLNDPIKFAGEFNIKVKLHPQVVGEFKLIVEEK